MNAPATETHRSSAEVHASPTGSGSPNGAASPAPATLHTPSTTASSWLLAAAVVIGYVVLDQTSSTLQQRHFDASTAAYEARIKALETEVDSLRRGRSEGELALSSIATAGGGTAEDEESGSQRCRAALGACEAELAKQRGGSGRGLLFGASTQQVRGAPSSSLSAHRRPFLRWVWECPSAAFEAHVLRALHPSLPNYLLHAWWAAVHGAVALFLLVCGKECLSKGLPPTSLLVGMLVIFALVPPLHLLWTTSGAAADDGCHRGGDGGGTALAGSIHNTLAVYLFGGANGEGLPQTLSPPLASPSPSFFVFAALAPAQVYLAVVVGLFCIAPLLLIADRVEVGRAHWWRTVPAASAAEGEGQPSGGNNSPLPPRKLLNVDRVAADGAFVFGMCLLVWMTTIVSVHSD